MIKVMLAMKDDSRLTSESTCSTLPLKAFLRSKSVYIKKIIKPNRLNQMLVSHFPCLLSLSLPPSLALFSLFLSFCHLSMWHHSGSAKCKPRSEQQRNGLRQKGRTRVAEGDNAELIGNKVRLAKLEMKGQK